MVSKALSIPPAFFISFLPNLLNNLTPWVPALATDTSTPTLPLVISLPKIPLIDCWIPEPPRSLNIISKVSLLIPLVFFSNNMSLFNSLFLPLNVLGSNFSNSSPNIIASISLTSVWRKPAALRPNPPAILPSNILENKKPKFCAAAGAPAKLSAWVSASVKLFGVPVFGVLWYAPVLPSLILSGHALGGVLLAVGEGPILK